MIVFRTSKVASDLMKWMVEKEAREQRVKTRRNRWEKRNRSQCMYVSETTKKIFSFRGCEAFKSSLKKLFSFVCLFVCYPHSKIFCYIQFSILLLSFEWEWVITTISLFLPRCLGSYSLNLMILLATLFLHFFATAATKVGIFIYITAIHFYIYNII